MVPSSGLEPPTPASSGRRSTLELRWHELEPVTGIEPALSRLRGGRVTLNTLPARMVHPPRFARGTVANQATVILNSPRVVRNGPPPEIRTLTAAVKSRACFP